MRVRPTQELLGPFPALTPEQRYHFDVFGYVVVENTLSRDQIERLKEALGRLRAAILADRPVGEVEVGKASEHLVQISNFHGYDPVFMEYLSHPWLVGMAEEVCGGVVRLNSCTAIVNSRDPGKPLEDKPTYGLHCGLRPGWGTWTENGLFHCAMARTFTNLTDIGPDDGGTVLIKGSHKIDAPVETIIACAYADRSLIHQVEAPAGSTLLFSESTVHATSQHRSDRPRMVVSGVYTPPMYQQWNRQTVSPEFLASVDERHRPLVSGSTMWEGWIYGQRYRRLEEPRDAALADR